MFGELLESRARRVRNRGGAVASVIGHTLFIAGAVAATRSPAIATRPVERVVPLPVLTTPAPASPVSPAIPRRPSTQTAAPTQTLRPIPTTIPPITLPIIDDANVNTSLPTEIGWSSDAPSIRGGIMPGAGAGTVGDGIPFAHGVDKPAIALSGNHAPRYPEILRRARVNGEVVVQVVIDTAGRSDMATLRVMSSTHPLLTDAVINALKGARFLPAESGGRKVRMWAVQSFVFEVK